MTCASQRGRYQRDILTYGVSLGLLIGLTEEILGDPLLGDMEGFSNRYSERSTQALPFKSLRTGEYLSAYTAGFVLNARLCKGFVPGFSCKILLFTHRIAILQRLNTLADSRMMVVPWYNFQVSSIFRNYNHYCVEKQHNRSLLALQTGMFVQDQLVIVATYPLFCKPV